MADQDTFSGEITVSSRIVDYLSSGLYDSPAACLKELINNSYDADAESVSVYVKPDANRIIIEDDGEGMSKAEFEHHFRRISESHKRASSDRTKSGRPKIGMIGIGFVAANEICDEMEIVSTKRGSTELLQVTIDFKKMRELPPDRRRGGGDFAKADYRGTLGVAATADHYTHVFLKRVRGEARQILAGAREGGTTNGGRSLYGMTPESIRMLLCDDVSSWSEFDSYSVNMLRAALNVPVAYADDWMPTRHQASTRSFERETEALGFRVFYDGTELRKPIVLCGGGGRTILRMFSYKGRQVSAKGYFFAQHGVLKPQELNGLIIRIRHAAIGGYDSSFLDFPSGEGTLFQRWISAEIWADDRLEDAMIIDRKTLRIAHPAFVELQQAVHAYLSRFVKTTRRLIYAAGSRERKAEKLRRVTTTVTELAADVVEPMAPDAARHLLRVWGQRSRQKDGGEALLRRYSTTELYGLVCEVAEEVLDRRTLSVFLKKLADRLAAR